MLDSIRLRETPEGIDLSIAPAGPIVRGAAWSIDFLIRMVVYIAAAIVLGMMSLGDFGQGIFLILLFGLEWLYPIIFEARTGQTPGKKRMGIRVINDDGTPPGWQACLVRNLLRAVDFLPFFYAFGLVSSFLNSDFKRLGDLAAGTLVVHDPESQKLKQSSTTNTISPIALHLSSKEQLAIIQFKERESLLSQSRQEELASILEPILPKFSPSQIAQNNSEIVDKLKAYASWLTGKSV